MKCSKCGEPFVEYDLESSTLVGYSSPPGHKHDDNCLSRAYKCKNEHWTHVSIRRRCPACSWIGRETCFCHPGKKVDKWPEITDEF